MTLEEAIKLNNLLIERGKDERRRSNIQDWEGERCGMCGRELAPGDWFLMFFPAGYGQRKIIDDSKRMHVECLDWEDRGKYQGSVHVARRGKPLLISEEIYDIIYGDKED